MKWWAALLLVANMALYLWATGHHTNQITGTAEHEQDVNREGMLLLNEVKPTKDTADIPRNGVNKTTDVLQPVNQSDINETLVVGTQVGSVNDKNTVAEQSSTAAGQNGVMCLRIGPFKEQAPWQDAVDWIQQVAQSVKPVSSERREFRATRVYLGPFDNVQVAQPMISALKQLNLDYYTYSLSYDDKIRISLGYFTQAELAKKFVRYLLNVNIKAKTKVEYRELGPFNWIETVIVVDKFQQFTSRKWGERTVIILKIKCKN